MVTQKMQILESAKVISSDVASYCIQAYKILQHYDLDQEKLMIFITHLAMACERIKKGTIETEFSVAMWQEISEQPEFERAKELYDAISDQSPVDYPGVEYKYLLLHICNLLK